MQLPVCVGWLIYLYSGGRAQQKIYCVSSLSLSLSFTSDHQITCGRYYARRGNTRELPVCRPRASRHPFRCIDLLQIRSSRWYGRTALHRYKARSPVIAIFGGSGGRRGGEAKIHTLISKMRSTRGTNWSTNLSSRANQPIQANSSPHKTHILPPSYLSWRIRGWPKINIPITHRKSHSQVNSFATQLLSRSIHEAQIIFTPSYPCWRVCSWRREKK